MRTILTITYCMLFSIAVLIHGARDRQDKAVAVQDLAADRLLRVEDLLLQRDAAVEHFAGRYLIQAKKRNENIDRADVNVLPSLSSRPGSVQLVLRVDRDWVTKGEVNAGSEVRVCGKAQSAAGAAALRFNVAAVLCPAPAPAPCLAAAITPAADAASAAAAAADASTSLRPYNTACG